MCCFFFSHQPELEDFTASGGEPPQCSFTLCFGEELSTTDDLASKLVIVQVSRRPPYTVVRSLPPPGRYSGRSLALCAGHAAVGGAAGAPGGLHPGIHQPAEDAGQSVSAGGDHAQPGGTAPAGR